MSFGGGGGSSQLISHTHNPAIPSDGGALSTTSPTTVSGLPIMPYVMVFS